MKKYLIFIIFTAILLFSWQQIIKKVSSKHKPQTKIENAINKGLTFLQKRQQKYGGFKTDRCQSEKMQKCQKVHTYFIPLNILLAINDIKSPITKKIKEKAYKLLKQSQDKNGLWYCFVNPKKYHLPKEEYNPVISNLYFPDIDTASLISRFLEINHQKFKNNKKIIEQNKKNGLYITFLKTHQPPFPHKNNIDIVVNANVEMYLQKNEKKICNYITKSINNHTDNSIYYQDKIVRYYFISRAYKNNITCLNKTKTTITNYLKTKQQTSGAFGNPLQTAIAITTLLNFGHTKNKLKKSIKYLLTKQQKAGNWKKYPFYKGPEKTFGSKELSTALALEAITKFTTQKK